MDMEFKSGLTELNMRVNEKIIKQTDMGSFYILMGTFIKDDEKMIKLMDLVLTCI